MPSTQNNTEESSVEMKPSSSSDKLQFPWKLHRLLEEAEANNHEAIISWMPEWKTFKIHDKKKIAELVMPQCFGSSKFKSFQRSLKLWGFQAVNKGADKGHRLHKLFVRGSPELCSQMKRTKIKRAPPRSHPAQEHFILNSTHALCLQPRFPMTVDVPQRLLEPPTAAAVNKLAQSILTTAQNELVAQRQC